LWASHRSCRAIWRRIASAGSAKISRLWGSTPIWSIRGAAPGAIAYTWLGYAGRTAAAGEAGAIKAGILALALLGAAAFLPRFIRRSRSAGASGRSARPTGS
jgi:hypothetical protein